MPRLNPYSTGSNSNIVDHLSEELSACLNPYSTGSNSNALIGAFVGVCCNVCLNPYSTGSNSNNVLLLT